MKLLYIAIICLLTFDIDVSGQSLYERLNSKVENVAYDDNNISSRNIAMENGFESFPGYMIMASVCATITNNNLSYELHLTFNYKNKPFSLIPGGYIIFHTSSGKKVKMIQFWNFGIDANLLGGDYSTSGMFKASSSDILAISEGVDKIEFQCKYQGSDKTDVISIQSSSDGFKWTKQSFDSLNEYLTKKGYMNK